MDPNNCSWIRIGELSSRDTVHRGGALVSDYGFDTNGNMLQHARYPAECGQKWVNGDFVFGETSTNDFAAGGLDKLF